MLGAGCWVLWVLSSAVFDGLCFAPEQCVYVRRLAAIAPAADPAPASPCPCSLPAPLPQTGEWQLPLPEDKLEAMRTVMRSQPGAMDESLLSACYSWMRKASEDKMDGE